MSRGRRKTKGFDYVDGVYYFTIKSRPTNITMHRKNKEAALKIFHRYEGIGKDIEWLGKWDGKNFTETSAL